MLKRSFSFLVAVAFSQPANATQSREESSDLTARLGRAQELLSKLDSFPYTGGVTRDQTDPNIVSWFNFQNFQNFRNFQNFQNFQNFRNFQNFQNFRNFQNFQNFHNFQNAPVIQRQTAPVVPHLVPNLPPPVAHTFPTAPSVVVPAHPGPVFTPVFPPVVSAPPKSTQHAPMLPPIVSAPPSLPSTQRGPALPPVVSAPANLHAAPAPSSAATTSSAQYVRVDTANGPAFFQKTATGLQVVQDQQTLAGLRAGTIRSAPQSAGDFGTSKVANPSANPIPPTSSQRGPALPPVVSAPPSPPSLSTATSQMARLHVSSPATSALSAISTNPGVSAKNATSAGGYIFPRGTQQTNTEAGPQQQQCAVLVQALRPDLNVSTGSWRASGGSIQNENLVPGTPIGTFMTNGRYPTGNQLMDTAPHYSSAPREPHSGIFLDYLKDKDGNIARNSNGSPIGFEMLAQSSGVPAKVEQRLFQPVPQSSPYSGILVENYQYSVITTTP